MWSVGCIMAELVAKEPLFRGKTEVEQLDKVLQLLIFDFRLSFLLFFCLLLMFILGIFADFQNSWHTE